MTNILVQQFSEEPFSDNNGYKEIINFSISFLYNSLDYYFEWNEQHFSQVEAVLQYLETKRYDNYSYWWSKGLPKCTVELLKNINSRRAVIHFLGKNNIPSCLSSVQFLVRDNKLHTIANFRSWELEHYGPFDVLLIKRFSEEMARHLGGIEIEYIYFNAASAHIIT